MQIAPLTGKAKQAVQLATCRYCIWEGSVRSGKTISSLLRWLKFVRDAPPGNLAMIGKTERTLKRNVIDPLIEMLGDKRAKYVAGAGELLLLGRRVYVAGANNEASVAKIQGLTLLGAYGDEISTWPESLWSMLGTRLSVEGAQFFGTCNPDSPGHWLKRDYLDKARVWLRGDGQLEVRDTKLDLARFSFRLDDNRTNLPAGYIEGLEAQYVGLWRKRFIDGEWAIAEGAVYDMWDPARHVLDVLPPIRNWVALGVDYGTRNPFAGLLLGLGDEPRASGRPEPTMYVASEWRWDSRAQNRQLSDAEYSERLRGWLDTYEPPHGNGARGVRPGWVVVDPSAASFVTQLYRDGLSPVLADNSVLDGIRTVSSLLAGGRLKVHRSCSGLIDELAGYAWDDDAAKKGDDRPIKLNDHSCDALRYAVHTTQAAWRGQLAA